MKKLFQSKRWIAFMLALLLVVTTCIGSSDAFLRATDGEEVAVSDEAGNGLAEETQYVEVEEETEDTDTEEESALEEETEAEDAGQEEDVTDQDATEEEEDSEETEGTEGPEETDESEADESEEDSGETAEAEDVEEKEETDPEKIEENAAQEETEELPEEIEEAANYGYTVSWYYDGAEDKSARVEKEGPVGGQIFAAGSAKKETVHSGKNYVLDRIDNEDGTITEDASKNVVKVYYVLKEEEKPAQTLTARAEDGAVVTVKAPAGALPKGSRVTISVVKDPEVLKKFEDAAKARGTEENERKIYDITIWDAEGKEIEPDTGVTVTVSNTGLEGDGATVHHADDKNAPVTKIADVDDANRAEFELEHFSFLEVEAQSIESDVLNYYKEIMLGDRINTFLDNHFPTIIGDDLSWEIVKNGEAPVIEAVPEESMMPMVMVVKGVRAGAAEVRLFQGDKLAAIYHITVKSTTVENPVYVYVKLDGMLGNQDKLSEETLKKLRDLGLQVNDHGWCTVGVLENIPIDNPMSGPEGTKKDSYMQMVTEEARKAVIDEINSGKMKPFGWHSLNLSEVDWFSSKAGDDFGLVVDNGADDYVESGTNVWHLNGYLDVSNITYTVKYVDKATDEPIADAQTITVPGTEMGKEIKVERRKIEGYDYVGSSPENETLTLYPTGNVITLYYEKPALSTKIFKDVDKNSAKAGETVKYSIEVENTSSGRDLSNVVITDHMTNAAGKIENVQGAKWVYDDAAKTSTFTIEKIPQAKPGSQNHRVTITYEYKVPDEDMGKTIENTVKLSSTDIRLEDDSKLTETVKIEKGVLTVKAGDTAKTYDGTTQTVTDIFAEVEVSVPGTGLKGIPVSFKNRNYYVTGLSAKAEGKDAGTYANVITADGYKVYDEKGTDVTERFDVQGENGTFTIDRRKVVLLSASLRKDYDGTVLKNEDAGKQGVVVFHKNGDEETAVNLQENGLWKVDGDGWAVGEGAAYTFTESVKLPNEVADNKFEVVPDQGTDLKNYMIETQFGTLSITNRSAKYEITLLTKSGNYDYDGKEHEVTGFADVDENNIKVWGNGTIEAKVNGETYFISGLTASGKGTTVTGYPEGGGYPVKPSGTAVVTDSDGKNVSDQFSIKIDEGLLTINERLITVTAGSASYKYTGEEFKASEMKEPMKITDGELVSGQFYKGTVSGSRQFVGDSETEIDNIWIYDENENDVTGNYKITCLPGKIEVTDGTADDKVDDALVVNKNADKTEGYEIGETVEFTISIRNIFDKDMTVTLQELPGVTFDEIEDDGNWLSRFGNNWKNLMDSIFGSENTETFTIKAGETKDVTVFYQITQADILNGSFVNKATVTLNDKTYDAEKEVKTEAAEGQITVKKTVSSIQTADGKPAEKPDLGGKIEYMIEVKNEGNLVIEDVVVKDELKGAVFTDLDGGKDNGDGTVTIGTLGMNGHKKLTAVYTVTEEDIVRGRVTNVATAAGKGPDDEHPVKVDDEEGEVTTETEEAKGYIRLFKEVTDPKEEYALGAVVEYEIKAYNDGNVSVKELVVEDALTGNTIGNSSELTYDGVIGPGEWVSLGKVSYTVTEDDIQNTQSKVKNIVTGTGKTGITDPVTGEEIPVTVVPGEEDITVEKDRPSLSITKKTDTTSAVQLGDVITYTITVVNNGNVTIDHIMAEDALIGKVGENALIYEGTLAPGESKTFTETYEVAEKDILAGRVKNTATVKGENSVPGGTDPEDEATVITPAVDINAAYRVEKSILEPEAEYRVGDIVSYEIRMENLGNVTLENVELRDELRDASGEVTFTAVNGEALENVDPMAPGTRVTVNNDGTVTVAALAPGETVTLNCEYLVARADAGNSIWNTVVAKADPVRPTEVDGGPADPDKDPIDPGIREAEAGPAEVEDIYNLIIRYRYADGTMASADYAGQYLAGETYAVYSPEIEGYRSSLAAVTGTMPAGDMVITVLYVAPEPVTPEEGGGETPTPSTPPTDPEPEADLPVMPEPVVIPPTPVPAGAVRVVIPTELTPIDDEEVPLQGALIDVDEDGNVIVTPINVEEVPLAGGRNDDHKCCILHFLLMLAALIIYTCFTHSMKKRQKKLEELKDQLAEEMLKRRLGVSDNRKADR